MWPKPKAPKVPRTETMDGQETTAVRLVGEGKLTLASGSEVKVD